MALNLIHDYYNFPDNLQTVTWTPLTGSPVAGTAVVLTYQEHEHQPTAGVYTRYSVCIRLPVDYFTTKPQVSEHIDTTDLRWTIQSVGQQLWSSHWICQCSALILNVELNNTISIFVPSNTVDDYGMRNNSPIALYTNIQCRIQPIENSEADWNEKRGWSKRFVAYCDFPPIGITGVEDIDIPWDSLVTDENGTEYVVVGYRSRERIEELAEIEMVIRP